MRGPLLSGPVGSRATLERVAQRLAGHAPAVVLSTTWLGQSLAEAVGVVLLVAPGATKAARRARRDVGHERLLVAIAGDDLPLLHGSVASIVVDGLTELDPDDAAAHLGTLVPYLRPDGQIIALDGTKDPQFEARAAALFLAAGLVGIGQERPREGAVLTFAAAPPAAALDARLRAEQELEASVSA